MSPHTPPRRYLVTGGRGFIGRHLARPARRTGRRGARHHPLAPHRPLTRTCAGGGSTWPTPSPPRSSSPVSSPTSSSTSRPAPTAPAPRRRGADPHRHPAHARVSRPRRGGPPAAVQGRPRGVRRGRRAPARRAFALRRVEGRRGHLRHALPRPVAARRHRAPVGHGLRPRRPERAPAHPVGRRRVRRRPPPRGEQRHTPHRLGLRRGRRRRVPRRRGRRRAPASSTSAPARSCRSARRCGWSRRPWAPRSPPRSARSATGRSSVSCAPTRSPPARAWAGGRRWAWPRASPAPSPLTTPLLAAS